MTFDNQALERAYKAMHDKLDTDLRLLFLTGYEAALKEIREDRKPDDPVKVRV